MAIGVVLALWIALPFVLWWRIIAAYPPQGRASLLLAADAAVFVVMGVVGIVTAMLATDRMLAPAGDTYVLIPRPGPYEAWTGVVLGFLGLPLLIIGHLAPFGPGRLALWLFALIHLAYGLSLLPRIVSRHVGNFENLPMDIELAGLPLMAMIGPAFALAFLASLAHLGWRWWMR